MSVRPIRDAVTGEVVVGVHPPIAPQTDAGWQRRLRLFTGRALSDAALVSEQEGRAGRLATSGQAVSHGVVAGLEVALETGDEFVPPEDRRNPEAWPYWREEEVPDPEPETLPRAFLHVAPGFGLAPSGEDAAVPEALRIPFDELWVYRAPLGATPPTAPAETEAVTRDLTPTLFASSPLGAPPAPAPEFAGPLWKLARAQRDAEAAGDAYDPLPPAAILVLQPVTAEMAGGEESADPCELDPDGDAFADWQTADGARLVLYAWPWPELLPEPESPTWRNEVANLVFRFEAALTPGEFHPWETRGVALGLVRLGGADGGFAPRFLDSGAVVRAGGRPRRRTELVAGAGSSFLWQARIQQFSEQVAESDWSDAEDAFAQFRYLPPAGLLPREAASPEGRPLDLFPPHVSADAVPVPVEQLDVVMEQGAPLEPIDLAPGAEPDRVRVMVPVPQAWYEPRLLVTEVVDPEFQETVDAFVARRTEFLRRRVDLRDKAGALLYAYTGRRLPTLPDRDRGEDEGFTEAPIPYSGLLAHESPSKFSWHEHSFTIFHSDWETNRSLLFPVDLGEKLFTYVYLDPADPPLRINLYWEWRDEGVAQFTKSVYWAPQPDEYPSEYQVYGGALPTPGRWTRLEVPAYLVGAETRGLSGMHFMIYNGRALWDRAGKIASTDRVWWDNAIPDGAVAQPPGWGFYYYPPPLSGFSSDVLFANPGQELEHLFDNATARLPVGYGDRLFVYVYPHEALPPHEIMVSWSDGSWEHRAFWGEDLIGRGTAGTQSRRFMGPVPPAGQWTRLEVPASLLGLEGRTLVGMSITLPGGGPGASVAWDRAGVAAPLALPEGTGLWAEYYGAAGLTGLKAARVDATLDYMPAGLATRGARWTGQIASAFTREYTFVVSATGTVRLWFDDRLVATLSSPQNAQVSVHMEQDQRYDLRVEYEHPAEASYLKITWKGPNEWDSSIPTRNLFPSATAGSLEKLPPAERVWFDDSLPPGATPTGNPGWEGEDGWQWFSAVPLNPPEQSFGTEQRGASRVVIPIEELRRELSSSTPLLPDEVRRLDELGLERFVAYLDDKVRRADDWVDFGFLRTQADMYRLRQLMVGTTAATRLATSPTLAAIIKNESAVTVRENILSFLQEVKLGRAGAEASALLAGGERAATGELSEPAPEEELSAPTALRTSFMSTSFASALSPTVASATLSPSLLSSPTLTRATSATSLSGSLLASTALISPKITLSPTISTTLAKAGTSLTPVISPITTRIGGGAATSEVIGKSPIVGETYDFRTVTVGERMETPPANESKSFAMSTRYELLDGLNRLGIALDDLQIPGFVRYDGGVPVYRNVTSRGVVTLKVPVREPRLFGSVRNNLASLVLQEPDPPDADESIFFNIGVELLDATTAALRAVEGRVEEYRRVVERCRAVMAQIHEQASALDRRLKTVEDELAEARHDVAVSRALLAEETERIQGINARRAEILREHVRFLAFHRPRLVHGDLDAPMRALDPAYTPAAVPAALASAGEAPPELKALLEMLREAPVRWFPALVPLVDRLDHPEVLLRTLDAAKTRATLRPVPETLESLDTRRAGKLGEAIHRRLAAQRQVVGEWRQVVAGVDLGLFAGQSWKWMRDRAIEVISVGDLVDAAHGRSTVDRGATRELDDILRVATALYERFGEVLPSIRLDWAEGLSQFDDAVDLRNLYSLARWGEVDYFDRRDMQSMVDWLFGRVEPGLADARALMSDVVRVCLLLASHAPVNQIVAGEVEREAEVRQGGTVALAADLSRVRIGMPVLMYDHLSRPVHGVVEDLSGGLAVTRIVKTPERASVTLPQGSKVQMGASVKLSTVDAVVELDEGTLGREASRERALQKMTGRRDAAPAARPNPKAR